MMRKNVAATFRRPGGESIEVPDPEVVCSFLLNASEKEWKTGSGDATLLISRGGETQELAFMCRPGVGMILTFLRETKSLREYLFSITDAEFGTPVSLFVGGDFFNFDKSLFVSIDDACKVVRQFMASADRPSAIQWIDESRRPVLGEDMLYGELY